MWVQFTSPRSLGQWIHCFFIGPRSLQLMNSFKIQWNHLAYKDTFCCSACNNCSEVNLTKVGFGNGGHCFVVIICLSHSWWVLARAWLITFWSFHLYTAMTFPKMRMFILAWSWCQGLPLEVEGFLGLAFSIIKPCTSFKCLVNNHLVEYATMQVPTLFPFQPNLHPFFVLLSHIRWTKGCRWLKGTVSFKF
jgi:hypothetical protein